MGATSKSCLTLNPAPTDVHIVYPWLFLWGPFGNMEHLLNARMPASCSTAMADGCRQTDDQRGEELLWAL